jgi:TatD DNase family protein
MLIESESPFMIPAYYRGKRNKPSYLHATAEFLAELRDIPLEELTEQIYRNSLTVFGLSS